MKAQHKKRETKGRPSLCLSMQGKKTDKKKQTATAVTGMSVNQEALTTKTLQMILWTCFGILRLFAPRMACGEGIPLFFSISQ